MVAFSMTADERPAPVGSSGTNCLNSNTSSAESTGSTATSQAATARGSSVAWRSPDERSHLPEADGNGIGSPCLSVARSRERSSAAGSACVVLAC